jgi:hypothetical protein
VVYAVRLLQDFFTKMVVSQDEEGIVQISETMISRNSGGIPGPVDLRRLEEIENMLSKGRLSSAAEHIKTHIEAQKPDPIGGSIAAYYLLTRQRDLDALGNLSDRMLAYESLSDSQIIRAAYLVATKRDGELSGVIQKALELGPPVYEPWLEYLAGRVDQLKPPPDPARVRLLKARVRLPKEMTARAVPGSLWSAWLPPTMTVGGTIEPEEVNPPKVN